MGLVVGPGIYGQWLDSHTVLFSICSMALNEWSRWGRGAAEGYNLDIGDGYTRFHASVVRSVFDPENGGYSWASRINGKDERTHPTREAAMARIEFELSIAGECFVRMYEGFKINRGRNRYSRAVDIAARDGTGEAAQV
jgi:hypothetical protein